MSGGGGAQNSTITNQEERLSGVQLQASSYGLPIPLYYKTHRAVGNMIWYGDFKATEHRDAQTTGGGGGGKGGGGGGGGAATTVTIWYTYSASIMLALGEGPLSVSAVMAGKDGWASPSAKGFEVAAGNVGQGAWGWTAAMHPAEAIGYSGTGYIAAANYQLGKTTSMPNFSVQLTSRPTTTVGDDITHFLTDPDVGALFPVNRLYGLSDLSTSLAGRTFNLSAITQKQAANYIKEWCAAMNAETTWSEGLLKFKPRLDSLTSVADLSINDFLSTGEEPPVSIERKSQVDAFNQYQVEYLDAAHEFNAVTATASDQGNIEQFGLRPAPVEVIHSIHDGALATWVAQHRLQRGLYVRNTYRFTLGWKHCRLEPMDVVTLTEPILNLLMEPVLIISVEEDEKGKLYIEAEEYNGIVANAHEYTPAPTGGAIQDHGVSPGAPNTPVIFEPPIALSVKPQVWMALSGGDLWGGAEIWASLDDATYAPLGNMLGNARHGTLRAALATGISPDITNTLQAHIHRGELIGTTIQGAADLLTLCYVDGEYISYRDATLMGVGDYDLGYLIRGAYGSAAAAHALGAPFIRLDESVFKYAYPPSWVGKTIYIKALGYNIYGAGKQSLADVTAIPYTITGKPLDGVQGLAVVGTFTSTACRIKWDAVIGSEDYTVEVYTGGLLRRTVTTTDTRFSYTNEDAMIDGGLARSLTFRVRANGLAGQSDWAQIVALNAQIAQPVMAHAEPGFGSASIGADFPAESDYSGTIIWAGDTSTFIINDAAKVYDGPNTSFSMKVDAGVTKWFRMAHYDVFGKDSLNMSGYFSVQSLALGGVPTHNGTPGTVYLDSDVVLSTTDDSLYVWNAAALPSPTYERAMPLVVANQITSINLNAISAQIGELLLGKMVMDAFGYIRGGQTAFDAGAGYWLGYDNDGKYKLSLRNDSDDSMTFDQRGLLVDGTLKVTGAPQINMLANPGFEANFGSLDSWAIGQTNMSLTASASAAYSGNYGLLVERVYALNAIYGFSATSEALYPTPGVSRIRASARIKQTTSHDFFDFRFYMMLYFYDAVGTEIEQQIIWDVDSHGTLSTAWVLAEGEVDLPVGAAYFKVGFFGSGDPYSTSTAFRIDDVSVIGVSGWLYADKASFGEMFSGGNRVTGVKTVDWIQGAQADASPLVAIPASVAMHGRPVTVLYSFDYSSANTAELVNTLSTYAEQTQTTHYVSANGTTRHSTLSGVIKAVCSDDPLESMSLEVNSGRLPGFYFTRGSCTFIF